MSGDDRSRHGPGGNLCRECGASTSPAVPWMRARGFCGSACEATFKTKNAEPIECGCETSREAMRKLKIAEATLQSLEGFLATWGQHDEIGVAIEIALQVTRNTLQELSR